MSRVGRSPVDLRLHLVTDAALCGDRGVVATAVAAVDGGATVVQVRERQADGADFLDLVLSVSDAVGRRAAVLVNDRVDVFLAARRMGAAVAGVHVG